MEKRDSSSDSKMSEFYAPATFQFSSEPGRIERFLARLFGRGEFRDGPAAVTGRGTTGPARKMRYGVDRQPKPR